MTPAITPSHMQRKPELLGQTVVVIGGSAGIGFETARRASAEGAKLILTGRNPERLEHAASEVHALSTTAFDTADSTLLERFFRDLPTSIDHIMVTSHGISAPPSPHTPITMLPAPPVPYDSMNIATAVGNTAARLSPVIPTPISSKTTDGANVASAIPRIEIVIPTNTTDRVRPALTAMEATSLPTRIAAQNVDCTMAEAEITNSCRSAQPA